MNTDESANKSREIARAPWSKVLIYLLGVLLAVAIISLAVNQSSRTATSEQSTFETIRANGTLRVGYIIAPPWVIRDTSSGELSGSFVELIEEIARQAELEVVYEEGTWSTFAGGLQSGRFDVSIAPTFSTIPRSLAVSFTAPQGYFGNSAIVMSGDERFSAISNVIDLDQEGLRIAVTQGEQGEEFARRNFSRAELKVISAADQSQTFSEVLAGRADVALGDAWFVAQFAASHERAQDLFPEDPYNVTPVAWAVRHSDVQLRHFLDTSLQYLDSVGFSQEVEQKYGSPLFKVQRILARD